MFRYRQLVSNLTIRDLKLKYKGSILGVAWSLLNPLLMVAIYTAVFSVFLRAIQLPHYWALVLTGILAWSFFANSLTSTAVAFVRNPNLVTKVRFPIESLPISMVLAHFVNFLITVALLLVLLTVTRIGLGPSVILLPIVLLAQLALAIGLGLILASITVHFRDVEHLLSIALAAWFYLTPVLYPLDPRALPHAAAQFIPYAKLNPMTWFLESYHSILYYGTWPSPAMFGLAVGSSILTLAAGYLVFSLLRPRLPESV